MAPGPQAEAVAVKGDRIVFVGSADECRPWVGTTTEVIDLQDRMLLPGFHDCHIHPIWGGLESRECSLRAGTSVIDYQAMLLRYAGAHPDARVIRGAGWLHDHFPGHGPSRTLLDAVVSDRPVYLLSSDAHSAWVNTKCLELAGISDDTPDPDGGKIERDAHGRASGTVREAAMALIESRLPPRSPAELSAAVEAFLPLAAKAGITAIHDALLSPEYLEAYLALERQGRLSVHVRGAFPADPLRGVEQAAEIRARRDAIDSALVRVHAAKFFADGVVEAHTACLLEAYADQPTHGSLIWDRDVFAAVAGELHRLGVQLHVHSIGDATTRFVLDRIAAMQHQHPRPDARHQLAHLDLIDAQDIPRFRQLGVIANMQPAWFYIDRNYHQTIIPLLGPDRAARQYRMQSLLESGAYVVCGSDWPASGELTTLRPLDAMQIGLTRLGLEGGAACFGVEELVNLISLLESYTRHAAYANFMEQETGTIEAGKSADLIVLDRNLFNTPVSAIHKVQTALTMFQGRVVHQKTS